MLTHSQAKSIAEARWGRGGTNSYRTTRRGAFYFSCSCHGGFVIDARTLTPEERVAIERYVSPDKARIYSWDGHQVLMHPYRNSGAKVALDATVEDFDFFLLEEDCDWCLAYLFTTIKHRVKPAKSEDAQRTFDQWIKGRVA